MKGWRRSVVILTHVDALITRNVVVAGIAIVSAAIQGIYNLRGGMKDSTVTVRFLTVIIAINVMQGSSMLSKFTATAAMTMTVAMAVKWVNPFSTIIITYNVRMLMIVISLRCIAAVITALITGVGKSWFHDRGETSSLIGKGCNETFFSFAQTPTVATIAIAVTSTVTIVIIF